MKYRIRTEVGYDGSARYISERKKRIGWENLASGCITEKQAQHYIDEEILRRSFKPQIVKEIDV